MVVSRRSRNAGERRYLRKIIIAIDGPAGSGKSTTARLVAESLGYTYLDTGAMYRAITLAMLNLGIDPSDENGAVRAARECRLSLENANGNSRVILNEVDVTDSIRSEEVTKYVSLVSSYKGVREIMVEKQREIGAHKGCVVDGRDIGTVVFPDADLKIYMVADIMERARRRQEELSIRGEDVSTAQVVDELNERDTKDSTRVASPLKKAPDAIEIDTTNMSIEEQVAKVLSFADEIMVTNGMVN